MSSQLAAQMSPEQWDKAFEKAVQDLGPLAGKVVRLAQEYDQRPTPGHGVSVVLMLATFAERVAKTDFEVHDVLVELLSDLQEERQVFVPQEPRLKNPTEPTQPRRAPYLPRSGLFG